MWGRGEYITSLVSMEEVNIPHTLCYTTISHGSSEWRTENNPIHQKPVITIMQYGINSIWKGRGRNIRNEGAHKENAYEK